MGIFDVVDELVWFEIVVDGIGLEDPLEVVEMRAVVMVVDPSCLHQQPLDVIILGVEDEDPLVSHLASLLRLPLPYLFD